MSDPLAVRAGDLQHGEFLVDWLVLSVIDPALVVHEEVSGIILIVYHSHEDVPVGMRYTSRYLSVIAREPVEGLPRNVTRSGVGPCPGAVQQHVFLVQAGDVVVEVEVIIPRRLRLLRGVDCDVVGHDKVYFVCREELSYCRACLRGVLERYVDVDELEAWSTSWKRPEDCYPVLEGHLARLYSGKAVAREQTRRGEA